jgi:hypothetical protein
MLYDSLTFLCFGRQPTPSASMSKTTSLYRNYKHKETKAFNLFFGHSAWRNWTFRELVRLTERELPALGRKRAEFLFLLKGATSCRSKIFAAFVDAPELRKSQHRYVVLCYQRILYLISSAENVSADTLPGDHTGLHVEAANAVNNKPPASEETINRLQNYVLFDILEGYIDAILSLWQQAQEGAISILVRC